MRVAKHKHSCTCALGCAGACGCTRMRAHEHVGLEAFQLSPLPLAPNPVLGMASPMPRSPTSAARRTSPASSPARPMGSPATGRREASPEKLAERVKELEAAEREAKKSQAKHQKQRQRELADAKKKVTKEVQAASRLVQKGEREATRLATKAEQAEKQSEQAKAKAARQHATVEESAGRIRAKRQGFESTLQEKVSVIGEARGRLAHAAFAAKVLESGVMVPLDGAAEVDRSPERRSGPRAGHGADDLGDVDVEADGGAAAAEAAAWAASTNSAGLARALQEENGYLRERLLEVQEELAKFRAGAAVAAEGGAAVAAEGEAPKEDEEGMMELQSSSTQLWETPCDTAAPAAETGEGGPGALATSVSAHILPGKAAATASGLPCRPVSTASAPTAACQSACQPAWAMVHAARGPVCAVPSGATGSPRQFSPQPRVVSRSQLPAASRRGASPPAKPAAAPPALLTRMRNLATPAKGLAKGGDVPMEPVTLLATRWPHASPAFV